MARTACEATEERVADQETTEESLDLAPGASR